MTLASGLEIPVDRIAEICRNNQVQEMWVFGSAARGDMRPDSDIDVLVVFHPDAKIGWDF